jgi:hypothetical protein
VLAVTGVTVHTAGENWASITAIVTPILVFLTGLAGAVVHRIDRNRDRTTAFVVEQVKVVGDSLNATLVSVHRHMDAQDLKLDDALTRTARIEGRLAVPLHADGDDL